MTHQTSLTAIPTDHKTPFTLTLLTATKPCVLSKSYNLVDGQLEKTPVAALVSGQIDTLSIDAPEGLIPLLAGLDNSKALMLGVATDPTASRIVTRRTFMETTTLGTIARTSEHFAYPSGPGFMVLDHDGLVDGRYLSPDELLEVLYAQVPKLRGVKIILFRSSSSHVYRIRAVLSLTLAARKFELPPIRESLGKYHQWEALVRRTLRYIEVLTEGYFADPVPQAIQSVSVNDDVRALFQLHEAFLEAFGTDRFTALDVTQRVLQADAMNLADAVLGATGRSERLSSKSVGRYLRKFVDRVVDGRVLRVLHGEKAMVYQMELREVPQVATPALFDQDGQLAA